MNTPNNTPDKMKLSRALELLNAIIDHMIELEGGHANRVVPTLLNVGFTAEELVKSFCFPKGILAEENAALEEDGNVQNQ